MLNEKNVPVLRYSPYSRAVTQVVRSGKLGQLVNAQHFEPVGHWHFAHAYVRGNWSKESESSFSLMTKSCQYVRARLLWCSDQSYTCPVI
jgi:predicted dehydrogenase